MNIFRLEKGTFTNESSPSSFPLNITSRSVCKTKWNR